MPLELSSLFPGLDSPLLFASGQGRLCCGFGREGSASRARCAGGNWGCENRNWDANGSDDARRKRQAKEPRRGAPSSQSLSSPRSCYLSSVSGTVLDARFYASLARACSRMERTEQRETERERNLEGSFQWSDSASNCFPLSLKVEEKKHFFSSPPPLFSMLARRASSYFSFRMGASLSTTYTSSGIEAAEAVAGREAIATTKATTSTSQSTAPSTSPAASTSSASTAPKPLAPPVEPCPEACCQSGCAECVWEVYYRERREYERALAEQQQRGSGGGREPAAGAAAASASPPPPPLDAFAALEAKVAAQEAEKARNRAGEAKS